MVDPLGAEAVEGTGDEGSWPLLAGMGDAVEPRASAPCEHFAELLRRIAPFPGIETDADEPIAEGERPLEGLDGIRFGKVAEEAHDEGRRHSIPFDGKVDGPCQAGDHRLDGDAAGGVHLGVEEDLGADDVVGVGSLEIGPGKVVEILLGAEDGRRRLVDIEEAL